MKERRRRAKLRKRWTAAVVAWAICCYCVLDPKPVYALFGIGDIVFDPSSYATLGSIWESDISNGIKLEETFQQTVMIYNNAVQIFNLAWAMSQRITHKGAWLTMNFPLGGEVILNHYNEAINFQDAMNGDFVNAPNAYQMSTFNAGNAGYLGMSTTATSRRMAEFASVQLVDQASQRCATVLATYNATQQQNITPIGNLGNDMIDESDGGNSEIAALNVLEGAGQQNNTQVMANGNLEACLAEQQTLTNKMHRDDLAYGQDFYNDTANEKAFSPWLLDPNDTVLNAGGGYLVP